MLAKLWNRTRVRGVHQPVLVILVVIVVIIAGLEVRDAAHAQAAGASVQSIRDTGNSGEVVVSWNSVPGALEYRVGWANYRAVEQAIAVGIPWTERFAFTDVRSSLSSHTVPNLMGGDQYAFIVGTRRGDTEHDWSEWVFHTTAMSPVCPSTGAGATPTPPTTTKPTITFADPEWDSLWVQNRIAQYIVEEGYGYPTDTRSGSTLPLFHRLTGGDVDVLMELWLPNQEEVWEEATANGTVMSLGGSLGSDWQSAFVIPAYLQRQYPDLDSIEDLKNPRFKSLFATPEQEAEPGSFPASEVGLARPSTGRRFGRMGSAIMCRSSIHLIKQH